MRSPVKLTPADDRGREVYVFAETAAFVESFPDAGTAVYVAGRSVPVMVAEPPAEVVARLVRGDSAEELLRLCYETAAQECDRLAAEALAKMAEDDSQPELDGMYESERDGCLACAKAVRALQGRRL